MTPRHRVTYMMHLDDIGATIEFYIKEDRDEAVRLADEAGRTCSSWEQVETLH